MVFDHDKALLGSSSFRTLSRLENIGERPILNGCIDKHIKSLDALGAWGEKIRFVSRSLMPSICEEARQAGALTGDERDAVQEFLERRSDKIVTVLNILAKPGQQTVLR
jgi:hypothetical protein